MHELDPVEPGAAVTTCRCAGGKGGEAGGFVGGDAEQAQIGLGELVDGGLGDAFGVPLAHPQQPKHAVGH